jgi:hypothetical protein
MKALLPHPRHAGQVPAADVALTRRRFCRFEDFDRDSVLHCPFFTDNS